MMMEGLKPLKVGNGIVGHNEQVVIQDHQLDMGDGMQCSDHPFRNNPGGICAFCLQDKLGKLVSSSFPPLCNSTAAASSSSSPSFRSDPNTNNATTATAALSSSSLSLSVRPKANDNATAFHHDEYYNRRARMSFLLARKKKKKKKVSANSNEDMIFKRSKSTTTPWRAHFVDASDDLSSPRKRNGFWSFLYHQHKANSKKLDNKSFKESSKISSSSSFASSAMRGVDNKSNMGCGEVTEDDDVSPNSQATACSFERKVSRSRSVGCGSRSFSGDIFERISTGFGDCTLRRVESQREGKAKPTSVAVVRNGAERVKCGGLFSGFMMTSSSTTTSSSSSYWVSSAPTEEMNGGAGRAISVHHGGAGRSGRGSSWGWAFASPMRAFSRPTSKDGKIIRKPNANSDKNTTPNLSAIPSLLSVR